MVEVLMTGLWCGPCGYLESGEDIDGDRCLACGCNLGTHTPVNVVRMPVEGSEERAERFEKLADVIYDAMPWEGETYQAAAESIAAAVQEQNEYVALKVAEFWTN